MKRWQSLFITLGLLIATALWAVPTFTPVLDGVQDPGWGPVPDHSSTSLLAPTEFNLDGGMYVTDDNMYVYFGFPADDDPLPLDGMRPHIHILVDVGSTPAGGTFSAWNNGSVPYNMPYKPEYDIVTQWGPPLDTIEYTGLNTWTTTGGSPRWVETQILTDAGGGGQFTEIAVSRLSLGNPPQGTVLNLTMWLRHNWSCPGGNCILPEQTNFPTNLGGQARTITVQFPYIIQTAYGDPVPPRLAQVHQIDRNSVELVFNEFMNQTTLQQSGNYAFDGWFQTGFRYITASTVGFWNSPGFVDGNVYSVKVLPAITDLAGNPIDVDYDSLGWTAPAYTDVTFIVHDPGDAATNVTIRGSWNFYHESGGAFDVEFNLYDDGTHGDLVPNDNDWTLILPLVPNGGTPNYRWKWLADGNWAPDPDLEFSLPDLTPITVEATIPDNITQEVTVSFDLDMTYQPCAVYDSITIAGPIGNWDGYPKMTDDGDGTYSYSIVFPLGTSSQQQYKYRYHYTNDLLEVVTVWETVPNHIFAVDDSAPTQVLPQDFWDHYVPEVTTSDVTVTFTVDMQCISATIDRMELIGTFTCWAVNPIVMTDLANGQYTADVLFPAGSLLNQEYKFRRIELGDPIIEDWETVNNRVLTLPEQPTYELGNTFFNDWLCPPVSMTAIRIGDNLHLQWVGPQRAYFQV
jgi:hypothetical protein